MPLLVLLVGPTAVGKNTIRDALRKRIRVEARVSYTTRAPRPHDVNGFHYHFVTREEFLVRVGRDEFAEWAEVHGHLYGTRKSDLEEALASGIDVLFDLDFQGAQQIKEKMPEAVTIFILPPTFAELASRLDARGSGESEVTKLLRLDTARRELQEADNFDYFVVNDDLEEAVFSIIELMSTLNLGGKPSEAKFKNIEFLNTLRAAL